MATGDVSVNDLQTIANGIINEQISPDKLPSNVRSAVYSYMGQSQGVNMSDPNSQITQQQLAELKQQRQDQEGSIFNSNVFKPIEWLGSKLNWVWSRTASPAISFTGFQIAKYGNFVSGDSKDYLTDNSLSFSDEWELAHHISPGQSIWRSFMSADQLRKSGLSEQQLSKQVKESDAGKFQNDPTKSDPFGTQNNIERYFSGGASKYVTGSTDLAVSWYADPLIAAGKGLGALKEAKIIRPVSTQLANAAKGVTGLSVEDINKLAWNNFTTKQPFQNLTDHIWDVKSANPDTAAAVLNRDLPTLSKSANGPAVAGLLSQATSKSEVANILRVTMGDNVANEALKVQNNNIAFQVSGLNNRIASIDTYYQGLNDTQKISPFGLRVKALMDSKSQQIADLDQQSQIITDKINAFGTINNMNFNSITTQAGLKARDAWRQSKNWQPFEQPGFIRAGVNNVYKFTVGPMIKVAHAYGDIKPTHYIDINDREAYRQLDASLSEVKGLTPQARDMYVSRFIEAPEGAKAAVLQSIEQQVAKNAIDRYNLAHGLTGTDDEISHEVGMSLYKQVAQNRLSAQKGLQSDQFGTAQIDNPDMPGTKIRVDQITPDGSHTVVTPLLRTQMANSHVMMDFKLFDNALKANGSYWQKALNRVGPGWERAVGLADYVNSVWKFSQLFRLGYGPRAMADDGLGQLARFGGAAMMSRALEGGKYTWQTLKRATTPGAVLDSSLVSREHAGIHIEDLTRQQASIQQDIVKARNTGLPTASLEADLKANIEDLASAREDFASYDSIVKGGAALTHATVGRQVFDPAYAGSEGGLFRDLASGEKNFQNMMGSASDSYLGRYRRMDWTYLDAARHGEDVHMAAWVKVLNQQVAHDALATQYLKGSTPSKLVNWLSTPEGLAYKRGHRIANLLSHDELVDRVVAQIDEWANPAFPNGSVIRQAAAKGEVTKEMLGEVPVAARPLVNGQALTYARGDHQAMQTLNLFMEKYYHFMGALPNKMLLRDPLFAQRYKVHLQDLQYVAGKTETHMTEDLRVQLESAARKRALQDVKRNTFTMDHETKMSHALRSFGAFFGAQQESWNRWARIISDKPDILPRVAQVMGAPTRAGITTDADGNKIDADGYTVDPVTGDKTLIPYSQRHTVIQVPDYLGGKAFKKFWGLDANATFDIPMSTANIILNHGDGPIPISAGPYVQIAADRVAKNSPEVADTFQNLGILPFGVNSSELNSFLPNWYRKAQGQDQTAQTYQNMMWYIMQAEDYKYWQGLRKTQPTWKEISDRASKQASLKTWIAVTLPVSLSAKDPYEFFRDQYRQMQSIDPQHADQNFYDKFGDSAVAFTQSLNKNNTGLSPTVNAVRMSKHYQDLISAVGPQWAGLIVGADDQAGVYSNGAYHYLKTHVTDPASGTTAYSTLSPRQALEQVQLARGWDKWNAESHKIEADLYQAGFQSFDDKGAEDFKKQKQDLVQKLGSPQILGDDDLEHDNPDYNEAWSKAYNSLDVNHYDRTAAQLRKIVSDPELMSKMSNSDGSIGMRSDLYTLKGYLGYRDSAMAALTLRKQQGGSNDINAQSNSDIKQQWNAMVMQLIQSDTTFGDLFHRYLSRDMSFDQSTVEEQQSEGLLPTFSGLDQFTTGGLNA